MFVSAILRAASRSRSISGPNTGLIPVLFTSRSSGPNADAARSTVSARWSGSSDRPATASATSGPPSVSTAWSSASGLRAVMTTRAPSATRRWAIARPMPRLAPVTSAVRPRRPFTAVPSEPVASQPEVPTDELLHDLVGAGPDLGHPGVAPGARDAVLVHVAVAAVQLDALVEDVVLHLGAPPLRLGCVDRGQLPGGVGSHALVHEGLGDVDLGLQLGDLELVVLKRSDWLAEGLALLHVLDRLVEDLRGVGRVADRRADALLNQALHHRDEAATLLADPQGVRHAHVVEEQLRRVRLGLADLVQLAAPGEAGHAVLDAEQRDPLGPSARVGARGHDDQVGAVTVGDERLRPVEHPVVAVAHRGGAQCGEVRAAARLGHRDGGDQLAGAEAGQPALLLRVRRQLHEVRRAHPDVDAVAGRDGRRDAGDLLGDHDAVAVVLAATAAPLVRHVQPEQALLAGLQPEIAGQRPVLDELRHPGHHGALQELAGGGAQRLVLRAVERAAHGGPPGVFSG